MTYYPKSRVEIKGFTAKHYDLLLDLATLGMYGPFLKRVIGRMRISPKDKILDLGAGTGRNDALMVKYLSGEGRIVAVDISDDMITQLRSRLGVYPNANIVKARIDRPLPLKNHFDKVFISFVLHGFPQDSRKIVVENAYQMLRDGGSFFVLDYNEFSLDRMPFFLRIPFRLLECPYAFDFIDRDWKKILADVGFDEFEEDIFYRYIRLLRAGKG